MAKQRAARLPTSATIIQALWNALDVALPATRSETIRKYLTGARPLGSGVLGSLLGAAAEAGYFWSSINVVELEAAISSMAAQWDRVVGHSLTLAQSIDRTESVTRYLRVAAIDLAIRTAGVDVLADVPAPPLALHDGGDFPSWVSAERMRRLIRALPGRIKTKRAAISTHKQFDDIFDARHRPSLASISKFSDKLASKAPTSEPRGWRLHLLWLFALRELSRTLEEVIERDVLEDVACGFRRARLATRQMLVDAKARTTNPEGFRVLLRQIVAEGARAPCIELVIDRLVRDELQWEQVLAYRKQMGEGWEPQHELPTRHWDRAAWAMALRAARADWLLVELTVYISPTDDHAEDLPHEVGARLADSLAKLETAPRALAEAAMSHPAGFLWLARTLVKQAFVRGNFEAVLPLVRLAVELFDTPQVACEAAVLHVAAGRLDEARGYFEKAVADEAFAPLVRPLVAFTNAVSGRHEEALRQLGDLGDDPSLAHARGLALRDAGRTEEALQIFERMLEEQPGQVLALEQAALCCFQLADNSRGESKRRLTVRGNRHAREASRHGRPVSRGRGGKRS